MMNRTKLLSVGLVACAIGHSAEASEGASSYYFPGAFGQFLVAVPPEPGFGVANQALIFSGNAQRAVLNGHPTLSLLVAPSVALGAHGYWYKQVDGDSGSGATFGPFKGESLGFGPAVLWVPESTKGKFSAVLEWLHDVSNTNRLNGDWGQIAVSWKF